MLKVRSTLKNLVSGTKVYFHSVPTSASKERLHKTSRQTGTRRTSAFCWSSLCDFFIYGPNGKVFKTTLRNGNEGRGRWWKRYASGWRISKPILCCTTRRAAIARIARIASSDARRIDCPQSFGSTRSWCMCKEESLDVRSSKAPYVMDVWKPGYGYGSCEGILKMHVECKRYT